MGLDHLFLFICQRFGIIPFLNLIQPRFTLLPDAIEVFFFKQIVQQLKGDLTVSDHRNGHGDIFLYGRRVNVNVNDLGLFGKGIGFSCYAVIKPDTDCDKKIAGAG